MRLLNEQNIEDIALGAAVLGTGGGGNPYLGMVMAKEAIRKYGPVQLCSLDELDDDDLVVPSAGIGAPTIGVEKLPNGDDIITAFKALEKYLGRPIKATMSIEAGGMNSVIPMYTASRLGIPLVDCDGMGRAFPEVQMVSLTLYGISATPMAMADERGNVVIMETIDNKWTETFSRGIAINMGGISQLAVYSATVAQLKEAAILNIMTKAEQIGRTIRTAHQNEDDPVEAVRAAVGGFLIFKGKITDVDRRNVAGFAQGSAAMIGLDDFAGQELVLDIQNEHLIARVNGEIKVTVPDLIVVLDIDSATPITTEMLRYGMRVVVMAFPCSEKWRTPAGIELVGPRYFGYDIDYVPVEERFG